MRSITHFFYDILVSNGIQNNIAAYINMLALLFSFIIIIFSIDYITRKVLVALFTKFAYKTKTNFDDILLKNKTPKNLAHIIPYLIAVKFIPIIFFDFLAFEHLIYKGILIFGVLLSLNIAQSILRSVKDYFKTLPRLKDKPIDSYIQVFMIFAWFNGILSILAIITETTFWDFAKTIGAASAIIILVFRDTILGFVASIQVAINDMVRIGDWVTFEKYGADGDVIEINLSTVKVQNFDKTITTIPTYSLISDSFKNWRGMATSDGRRIKRAIYIKQNTVRFIKNDELADYKRIQMINEYIDNVSNKIDTYNTDNKFDKSVLINGRNLTNLGLFRKYAENYLNSHSAINKDMMVMARQLPPTTQGIPIEIYAFSTDKRWENYEYIIADIFDHLIAAVPYFNLEIFEQPNNSSFISHKN